MTALRAPFAAPFAVLVATGCVARFDLLEAPCPCLDGYLCDPIDGVCRAPSPPPPDGGVRPPIQATPARYVDVDTAFDQSCGVLADGSVACWGSCLHSKRPVLVDGISDAQRVVIGGFAACVLRAGGLVACFDLPPQLETCPALSDTVLRAREVPLPAGARHLTVGARFACAYLEDGRRACWGSNEQGEFGTTAPAGLYETPIVAAPTAALGRLFDVETWDATTCAVHGAAASLVTCWPIQVESSTGAVQVDVGAAIYQLEMMHADLVTVLTGNAVEAWVPSRAVVTRYAEDRGVVQLARGCLRHAGGTISCLPFRELDFTGIDFFGVTVSALEQTAVAHPGGLEIVDVANGPWHGNFVDSGGTLYGFGDDGVEPGIHRVPDGHEPRARDRQIVARLPAGSVPFLGRSSGAATTPDGEVLTWGLDTSDVLGRGPFALGREPFPRSVPGRLATGRSEARQLLFFGGTVDTTLVMRAGDANEVGIVTARGLEPIAQLDGALELASGNTVLCGRMPGGEVRCRRDLSEMPMPSLAGATGIGVDRSDRYVVGIVDGRIACAPVDGSCPAAAATIVDAVEVALGDEVIVVRRADGGVVYLGGSDVHGAATAAEVPLDGAAAGIAAHSWHFCAWETSGRTVCWGDNARGQVDPDADERIVSGRAPLALATLYDRVWVGFEMTCGRRIDGGALECWGANDACQLGRCPGLVHHEPVRLAEPVPVDDLDR